MVLRKKNDMDHEKMISILPFQEGCHNSTYGGRILVRNEAFLRQYPAPPLKSGRFYLKGRYRECMFCYPRQRQLSHLLWHHTAKQRQHCESCIHLI